MEKQTKNLVVYLVISLVFIGFGASSMIFMVKHGSGGPSNSWVNGMLPLFIGFAFLYVAIRRYQKGG